MPVGLVQGLNGERNVELYFSAGLLHLKGEVVKTGVNEAMQNRQFFP